MARETAAVVSIEWAASVADLVDVAAAGEILEFAAQTVPWTRLDDGDEWPLGLAKRNDQA
jgi:hypothetical protein